MGKRTATLILMATLFGLLLTTSACDEEEAGEKCCNCTCYRIDMCDPAMDFTIYPEGSPNCESACDDHCDAYKCYSQDPEMCDDDEGGGS